MKSLIGVVLTGVPAHQAGGASGTLATSQQFASAIGVAGLGEVFFGVLGAHPTIGRYVSAIQDVLLLDCGLVAVALALTQLLPRAVAATVATTRAPVMEVAEARESGAA